MIGALRGLLTAAVVSGLAMTGCGDGEASPRPVAPIKTSMPEATFAPEVNLHREELWWPLAVTNFIDYSSFKWANDPCSVAQTLALGRPRISLRRDIRRPPILPARLAGSGAVPYRIRPRSATCGDARPEVYRSNQHTRPFDRGRPADLRPGEGFQLDLLTAKLHGDRARRASAGARPAVTSPVYYEQTPERVGGRDGLRITYWMLYGFNSPRPKVPGGFFEHEGDWERLSVLLSRGKRADSYLPVSVRFHRDTGAVDLAWDSLDLTGRRSRASHPVVYAARGSHSLYPDVASHRFSRPGNGTVQHLEDETLACRECPRWETWDRLEPVRSQPWYGYGGSWGRLFEDDGRSGPLGPSPFVTPSAADRPGEGDG